MLEDKIELFYRTRLSAALAAAVAPPQRSAAALLAPVQADDDLLKAAIRSALGFSTYAHTKYSARPTGIADISRLALLAQHGQTKYDEALGRINAVLADIDGFSLMPRPFQLRIIDLWIELSAPVWFGNSWQARGEEIRTRFAWKNQHIGIGAVQSGRKDGKSTGGAFTAALALLNVPNYSIHVFTTKLEQSMIILNMTYRLLLGHARASEFRIKCSETKLTVELNRTDVRTMEAMSGSVTVRVCFHFVFFYFLFFFLLCCLVVCASHPPFLFFSCFLLSSCFLCFFFPRCRLLFCPCVFLSSVSFAFCVLCLFRQQVLLLRIRDALRRRLHVFARWNRRAARVRRLLHAAAHKPDDALVRLEDARLHDSAALDARAPDRHADLLQQLGTGGARPLDSLCVLWCLRYGPQPPPQLVDDAAVLLVEGGRDVARDRVVLYAYLFCTVSDDDRPDAVEPRLCAERCSAAVVYVEHGVEKHAAELRRPVCETVDVVEHEDARPVLCAQTVEVVPVAQASFLVPVEWPVDNESEWAAARAEVLHGVECAGLRLGLDEQDVAHVVFCGGRQREDAADAVAQQQLDVGHARHWVRRVREGGELEDFEFLDEVVVHIGNELLALGVGRLRRRGAFHQCTGLSKAKQGKNKRKERKQDRKENRKK